jgi:hypothetical protein
MNNYANISLLTTFCTNYGHVLHRQLCMLSIDRYIGKSVQSSFDYSSINAIYSCILKLEWFTDQIRSYIKNRFILSIQAKDRRNDFIATDARFTTRYIAKWTGISVGAAHTIVKRGLKMRRISASCQMDTQSPYKRAKNLLG